MNVVAGNRNGSDQRALPEILIVDFGHRNIKFVAQPVLQAFHRVAFVF